MRFFCFIAIMLSLSLSVSTPAFSLTNLQSGKISGIYISPGRVCPTSRVSSGKSESISTTNSLGTEYRQWEKKFGSDYIHYHHWAFAVVKYRRAMTQANWQQRKFYLKGAVGEYDYLLRHCLPENSFRYLFHYKKAEALVALNDLRSAITELTSSLNYKNDFVPAYLVLSECYSRLGMQKESAEVIELMKQRTGKQQK